MSTNVFNKLAAEVGDVNIGIATDSMGSGDPNIGRRTAQAFAKMYPKINVRYRRYVDAATAASTGSTSNSIQTIQTGTIAQTLTVWNGCMPGNTLAYQTANYDSIYPQAVLLDVMMIITGHTNGMATDAEMLTTIRNFITLTRTKSPNCDTWISTENLQLAPILEESRIRHYERQVAIRGFAGDNNYAYIPILEAFDEREPDWPVLIQSDGVHPTNGTDGGYDLWSQTIESFLIAIAPEVLPPVEPQTGFAEYVANLWKQGKAGGTPITAEWLNHIEQGIANANFMQNLVQIIAFGPGIDMTGKTDSSEALQVMVTEAQRTGKKLIIPPGIIKASVITDMTVQQPVIEGSGGNTTSWFGLGAGKPCITMQGVSGAQSYGRVRNMRIQNAGGVGVELQGTIGVFIESCDINGCEVGVLFHNKKGTNGAYAGYQGDYTEFCQVVDTTFRQGCKIQIEYRRTGGHASFHGTGFRNTIFNQTSSSWGKTNIIVGAGCTVYNAPWDGMFFIGNPGLAPIYNGSTTPVRVHGDLTFEARPGVVQNMVNGGSASPVYLAGHLNRLSSNSGSVKRGTRLYLVDDVTYFGTSSTLVSHHKKPYEWEQSLVSGANIIYEVGIDVCPAQLIAVNVTGSAYNYHALLYITRSTSGTATNDLKVLSTGYSHDNNNLGAPAYSMSGNSLVITKTGIVSGKAHLKITNLHSNRAKVLV